MLKFWWSSSAHGVTVGNHEARVATARHGHGNAWIPHVPPTISLDIHVAVLRPKAPRNFATLKSPTGAITAPVRALYPAQAQWSTTSPSLTNIRQRSHCPSVAPLPPTTQAVYQELWLNLSCQMRFESRRDRVTWLQDVEAI